MAELHAIGTVVSVDERRYVVVGHRLVPDGAGMAAGYVLVPYPLGFVDADSLSVVAVRRVDKVVAEGFETAAGDAHLASVAALAQESAGLTAAEYEQGAQLLRAFAREGGADA